jgi:two-component system, chemotaxis family, protein-glutamate methylesterase/glutaminase
MSGIVVIGASLGGLHALEGVLEGLPEGFPVPVLIVQHRAEHAPSLLVGLLRSHSRLEVCEAEDKSPLVEGPPTRVMVAPAGYHVLVEHGHLALSTEAEVRFNRPSIDLALESAAGAYGREAVGVVLTGANDDGARGLVAIRRAGGVAIVQDPEQAARRAMPDAAIAAAAPQWVLTLEEIGPRLAQIAAAEARP